MTTWQYLVTVIQWTDGHWRPHMENGQPVDPSTAAPMYEYLNEKGADGWELVTAPPSNKAGVGANGELDPHLHVRLIFKRPAA